MNSVSTYILFSASVGIAAILMIPKLESALFALLRMTSSLVGVPWP